MDNSKIIQEIQEATANLLRVLGAFREEQIDIVPFENSWTAGQVAEHLLKVESGLPHLLTSSIEDTPRPYDAHVEMLRTMFMDFTTKLNAPSSTVPSDQPHLKSILLDALERSRQTIIQISGDADLSKTCGMRPFPTVGNLTRLEWLNFLACHSKRHTHQLETILSVLSEQPSVN